MQTFTLLRRVAPVVACGALAVAATACGSGSGSAAKPPSRPATTSAAATTTPPTASAAGPVTTTAGASPGGQLAGVEEQLASVPGLLQQAQSANTAADPDQARAAEGG